MGKGSGPASGKRHAGLEGPAFWIQHDPEKAVRGRSLVGRQAEAHTTEGPAGHLSARAFLASCGEFVPMPPCNPGFGERGFLGPGHRAEFGVRLKNTCRNSTVCERLCKHEVVSWAQLNVFFSLDSPFLLATLSKLEDAFPPHIYKIV